MTKANLYNYTNTILFNYLSGHGNMILVWLNIYWFTGYWFGEYFVDFGFD